MAVDADVSRAIVREELEAARDLTRTYKWDLIPDFGILKVLNTMYAHNGDRFVIEVQLDNYKEFPPYFEFIDPETGERGTKHAYPKSTDTLFHENGPCICAPFNRKAYKDVGTGLHSDWNLGEWASSRANNFDWSDFSTLAGMLNLIQTRLSRPELYKGRMG